MVHPSVARSQSMHEHSAASKAIEEAKRQQDDAKASSKHFKEWIRKVPHQVQSLIDALVTPASAGSPNVHGRHMPSDMQFVPRAAQYIATDSLIHSVIYLGRYLAIVPPEDHAQMLLPQRLLLTFSTCMVLADKFSNDDAYDDLLPAIGIVTGIQPKVLRKKEVALLGTLMNTSGLFVAEEEFESFVYLLEENPWSRLKREGSLSLLMRTAREHLDVEALHLQLFSAHVRTRAPALTQSLKAFSEYVRTNRPRPRLPSFVGGVARGRSSSVAGTGTVRERDEGVVGGADGQSKSFRLFERARSQPRVTEQPAAGAAGSASRPRDSAQVERSSTAGSASGASDRRPLPSISSSFKSMGKGAASAPASPTASNGRRRFDIFGILSRVSKAPSPGLARRATANEPSSRSGSFSFSRGRNLNAAVGAHVPGTAGSEAGSSAASALPADGSFSVKASTTSGDPPDPPRGPIDAALPPGAGSELPHIRE